MTTAEYIERDRLIEDLTELAKYQTGERQQGILGVIETIRIRKAADAVPVVRCKDCIYSYEKFGFIYCTFGPYGDCAVPSQFYCAEGKKKGG